MKERFRIFLVVAFVFLILLDLLYASSGFVDPTPSQNSNVTWFDYTVNFSLGNSTPRYFVPDYNNSMLGFWTWDDANVSGTTIIDISGNRNCTSYSGGFVSSVFGNASDGGGYCVVADSPEIQFNSTDSFTACARFNSTSSALIIIDTINNSLNRWNLFIQNGYVYSKQDGFSAMLQSVNSSFDDGEWHFACVVRDTVNDEAYLYVDGILEDTNTRTDSGDNPNVGGFYIVDGIYTNTQIDDVFIIKSALSSTEINYAYNSSSIDFFSTSMTNTGSNKNFSNYFCDATGCNVYTRNIFEILPDSSDFSVNYPDQWGIYQRDNETHGNVSISVSYDYGTIGDLEYSFLDNDTWYNVSNLTEVTYLNLVPSNDSYMNGTTSYYKNLGSSYWNFDVDTTYAGKLFIDFVNGTAQDNQNLKISPEIINTSTTYYFEFDLQKVAGDDCNVMIGTVFSSSYGSSSDKFLANSTEQHFSGTFTSSDPAYLTIGILAADNNGCNITIDNLTVKTGANDSVIGTLENLPVGQGDLFVRAISNVSKIIRVSNFGVGDVFLIMGQSNAVPHFDSSFSIWNNLSYQPTEISSGEWGPLNSEASSYPFLLSRIIDSQNIPVGIIQTAQGGTTINLWSLGGIYYNRMLLRTGKGTGNLNKVKAILYYQGETDVISNCAGDYDCYYNSAVRMYGNLSNDLNILENKIIFGQINMIDYGYLWPNHYWIQKASSDLWSLDNFLTGPYTYWISQTSDNQHFELDDEATAFMTMWANTVLGNIYSVGNSTGPVLQSAVIDYDNRTKLYLTFDKEITQIGDYKYNTSYSKALGFIFYDGDVEAGLVNYSVSYNGSFLNDTNVLSTTINNSEVVVLALDTELNESYKLMYGTLNQSQGKPVLMDSNSMPILQVHNFSLVLGNLTASISSSTVSTTTTDTSDGSSGIGTYKPSKSVLENGYSVNVVSGQKVQISFDGEMKDVEIKDVSDDKVVVSVDGNDYEVSSSASGKIDLDNDGFYDVEISSSKIYSNGIAKLEFKLINEEVPSEEQEGQSENVNIGEGDSETGFFKSIGNFFGRVWDWISFWN